MSDDFRYLYMYVYMYITIILQLCHIAGINRQNYWLSGENTEHLTEFPRPYLPFSSDMLNETYVAYQYYAYDCSVQVSNESLSYALLTVSNVVISSFRWL